LNDQTHELNPQSQNLSGSSEAIRKQLETVASTQISKKREKTQEKKLKNKNLKSILDAFGKRMISN
jgi:hypothetical protein